jgi:hypothetical protein
MSSLNRSVLATINKNSAVLERNINNANCDNICVLNYNVNVIVNCLYFFPSIICYCVVTALAVTYYTYLDEIILYTVKR